MFERAVYCTEEDRWYKQGDDPWTVRDIPADRVVTPIISVIADTYGEAFELLFGHAVVIPAPVRSARRALAEA